MQIYEYDPEILKTEAGRVLHDKWIDFHRKPCSEEFKNFQKFYEWSMENGFKVGMKLLRYDANEPFSADNCVWSQYKDCDSRDRSYFNAASKRQIQEWNNAINRIRKHYGMAPLGETEGEQA